MINWTNDMDTSLRAGISDKLSAREIGIVIGVSRNAVIGRAFRLGLSFIRHKGGRPPKNTKLGKRYPRLEPNPNDYIDRIMDLRDEGCAWHKIASELGLPLPRVRRWAIVFGGYQIFPMNKFSDEDVIYLMKAWRDHVPVEDMADHLGRTLAVIRQKILQMQKAGLLSDIVRDPAKTRLLKQYGEQALAAGATPSEALHNLAEAKRQAYAEAVTLAREVARRQRREAIDKMLGSIEDGKERNIAIFNARVEGATLEEIATAINPPITRERVRQICRQVAQDIALHQILEKKQDELRKPKSG